MVIWLHCFKAHGEPETSCRGRSWARKVAHLVAAMKQREEITGRGQDGEVLVCIFLPPVHTLYLLNIFFLTYFSWAGEMALCKALVLQM